IDFGDLPYVLRPASPEADEAALVPRNLVRTQCLAQLARPPARELSGVRLVLQPDFDVTPEQIGGGDDLMLGDVLDRPLQASDRLPISLATVNRHAFVCGATGAGKSQTVRHLLEELDRVGIPW